MEYNIFLQRRDSHKSFDSVFNVAYRNFINGVNIYLNNQIQMAELKIAWWIAYCVGVPVYIYAAATNFDTWKAVILFIIAACTGLLTLGRLSVKFFKELLTVLVEYRKEKISIDGGVKQLYIIISLLIVILILIAIVLFLNFK